MQSPLALRAFPLGLACSMLMLSSCGSGASTGENTPPIDAADAADSADSTAPGDDADTGSPSEGGDDGASDSTAADGAPDSTPDATNDGGPRVCLPKTCAELAATCGPQGDGCGNLIQCGNCKAPQTCGGGGTPSACGGDSKCVPKTCADWKADCGPVSDGCGGLVQCGDCGAGKSCGGGGTPGVCGGSTGCVPTTCALQGVNCGPIGDGCGGLLQCGACGGAQSCGGGGSPGVCGTSTTGADAGSACVPTTCALLGVTCGPEGDGCGGQLDCGTCTAPKTCGGGGVPSQCGGASGCVPHTCAQLGIDCGPAGDGCGGTIQCGSCTAPKTCGGGGSPGVCGGSNACVPKTCAQLGVNCGPTGDGCGGLLQCGSCTVPQICGGGGQPGVCGPTTGVGSCTGLCLLQQSCPGSGVTTTVTGTVYAPNGTDPLFGALVYVPNGGASPTYGVSAFTPGVHCGQCGSEVSGTPLVSTKTAPDGTFTLQNVPVGSNIPLVIQLGRWRRKVTIPSVGACTTTALSANQTRLPTVQAEGDPADNIPLMAFSTGQVDGLECVLLKVGISPSQFSNPASQGGLGRVRLYTGEGAAGAQISATTPSATQLYGSQAEINQYDTVFFPCQGAAYTKNAAQQAVVLNYANAGGRVFATHYSYTWLINPTPSGSTNPFLATANWTPGAGTIGDQTGFVNTAFPRGQALAQWLQIVGASTAYAQIPVNTLRTDFTGVVAPSLLWLTLGGPSPSFTWPMHYTFDTPVGNTPATQCGRVLFDDFHVENATSNTGLVFPAECAAGPMTAQERLLEFMIFDLGSCLSPTVVTPPTCTPLTCSQQGLNCGPADDGCGNQLSCGACSAPQTCGGGGQPSVCGGTACAALSCTSQGIQCGPAGDGCGNLIQCGNCPSGQTCGGGGLPGKCGKSTCTKVTCASQGVQCGPAGDGCGGVLLCGDCPTNQQCGQCSAPGTCGSCCVPTTCAKLGYDCGPAGDGCGGALDCGTCTAKETCGGGGAAGRCGS